MTKGKILQSIWDNLPDERKQRIQDRAEELETEYLTLHRTAKSRRANAGGNFTKLANAAI